MDRAKILERAIQIAIANGYRQPDTPVIIASGDELRRDVWWLIFNHEFAKALWPTVETRRCVNGCADPYTGMESYIEQDDWVYHLQQMVIAEDPVAYLADHI